LASLASPRLHMKIATLASTAPSRSPPVIPQHWIYWIPCASVHTATMPGTPPPVSCRTVSLTSFPADQVRSCPITSDPLLNREYPYMVPVGPLVRHQRIQPIFPYIHKPSRQCRQGKKVARAYCFVDLLRNCAVALDLTRGC
jgi:hypothetical protein